MNEFSEKTYGLQTCPVLLQFYHIPRGIGWLSGSAGSSKFVLLLPYVSNCAYGHDDLKCRKDSSV